MARVTIADVARAAGVSKGAASHALNGMPGVSERTRARVVAAAEDLHWTPNSVARALSGSRVGAIGWAIRRTRKSASIDPYFMELFAGIELELAGTDSSLVVKLVEDRAQEGELYRRWSRERRVDGVLLLDFDVDDDREALLASIGMPFASARASLGDAPGEDAAGGSQTIWSDEAVIVPATLDPVLAAGHRRIVWVSGDPVLAAIAYRRVATDAWAARNDATVMTVSTDFSAEQGAAAALDAMRSGAAPTCLVFDNDLVALAAQRALQEAGFRVPGDVSTVAFVDSPLCEVADPPIAAVRHDPLRLGRGIVERLVATLDGRTEPLTHHAVALSDVVRFERRASLGPPRAGR